jgi:large subunit ribosomal protein L10
MSRHVKDMIIRDIESRIADTADFIAVDCSRLDALTANRWRLGLQEANISALTVKNSLMRCALKNKGVAGLDPVLEGPTTLVWGSEDVVALSRSIVKWAGELEALQIKGAAVEGESLDASAVEALSKSAGRLETIGELAGLMLAPGRQLAGAMQAPGGMLAGQLKTIADKEESQES